jgi:hypothetical protein
MRKAFVAVALLSLLIPALGLAQAPARPGPNQLGLYTATDETARANVTIVLAQFDLYLVMTGCTVPEGVFGWEVQINFPATGLVLGAATLFGSAVNVGTLPDYAVGLATPLPFAPAIVLAQWQPFVLSGDPMYAFFAPITNPSIPASMVFAGGNDPGNLLPMNPSSGDLSLAVFGFNTGPLPHESGGTIPTEEGTWGGVKAIYR